MEAVASSYFEFFLGDFFIFGVIASIVFFFRKKEDEDFYNK